MATANDSVYVKFVADTSDFMNKVKGTIQPLQQFMRVMHSLMTLGGAAIVLKQIASQIGEMEKAYVKLHPESQAAVGSLTSWNEAMATMKADGGAIVASVLTPIREAFLNIVAPISSATYELTQLQKGLQAIADKYLTTERKQYESRQAALDDLAKAQVDFTKAVNTQSYYEDRLAEAQEKYNKALAESKRLGGYGGTGAAAMAAETDLKVAKARAEANQKVIDTARTAIRNAEEWLSVNKEVAASGGKPGGQSTGGKTPAVVSMKELQETIKMTSEEAAGLYDYLWKIHGWSANATPEPIVNSVSSQFISQDVIDAGDEYIQQLREIKDYTDEIAEKTRNELAEAWGNIADFAQSVGAAMGEAFVTGDYIQAIQQIITAVLDLIAKEAIAAGLKMILMGNVPMGLALMAIGGVVMGIGGAVGSSGRGGGSGIEAPRMASGGIVTRPTLALIGEAGPEAVVPLGRGGTGDVNIIVQGSVWQTEDLARAVAGAMGRW